MVLRFTVIASPATAALVVMLVSSVAGAQPVEREEARAVAQARFAHGREAYDRGEHREALEQFEQSLAAYDSPVTRLYLARTLREIGELGAAYAAYELARRAASDLASSSPRYAAVAEAAAAEQEELRPRIGFLELIGDPPPDDGAVRVRGRALPTQALGLPIPVTPGEVLVELRGPDRPTRTFRARVAAGERNALEVEWAEAFTAEPAPDLAAAESAESPSHDSTAALSTSSLLTFAAAASAGVAIGFGVAAEDRFAHVQDLCPDPPACPPEVPGLAEEGRSFERAAQGAWIAAGVVLVGAVIAWIVTAVE
jgi:tetratricopeptide (TPR) repeat protein